MGIDLDATGGIHSGGAVESDPARHHRVQRQYTGFAVVHQPGDGTRPDLNIRDAGDAHERRRISLGDEYLGVGVARRVTAGCRRNIDRDGDSGIELTRGGEAVGYHEMFKPVELGVVASGGDGFRRGAPQPQFMSRAQGGRVGGGLHPAPLVVDRAPVEHKSAHAEEKREQNGHHGHHLPGGTARVAAAQALNPGYRKITQTRDLLHNA